MTADIKPGEIKKRGLGRGLDALFGDAKKEEASFQRKEAPAQRDVQLQAPAANPAPAAAVRAEPAPQIKRADEMIAPVEYKSAPTGAPRKLPVSHLQPGKFQPRRHFDEDALANLAESISVHGVFQPLLVRPVPGNHLRDQAMYEIIAGERRWRAAQKAGVHDVPVIIQELSDNETLEIALIENLQREDLAPLEEAEGYQRLMDEFRHTQDVLAHRLGKSRSHVTNTLRLLKLTPRIKKYMQEGQLTAGHARALVGLQNADQLADAIVKRSLNVRQTEKLVRDAAESANAKGGKGKKKPEVKGYVPRDVDVMALEERMSSLLGLKVTIDGEGAEGMLHIEYSSLDQLDDIVERLTNLPLKRH
jgi:ParB family chromosome partitioning protein